MYKSGFFLFAALLCSLAAHSQQLYMERTFGGARFETDSLTLGLREVQYLLHENAKAVAEIRKARVNYGVSGLLGFTGGVLVAVPVVTAVIGGKPEWILAGAGGALILISIPVNRAFYRHAENALEEYNAKYQTGSIRTHFYFTGTGAKLVFRF